MPTSAQPVTLIVVAALLLAVNTRPVFGELPMSLPVAPNQTVERVASPTLPAQLQGFASLKGASASGKTVFGRLSCLDCHSLEPGTGGDAPSLDGVGTRLTATQLAIAILDPSRELSRGYSQVTVSLDDGRVIQGTEDESASSDATLVLRSSGKVQGIARDTIEEIVRAESDMPAGQADELTSQEFADLLAYLQSLQGTAAVASR